MVRSQSPMTTGTTAEARETPMSRPRARASSRKCSASRRSRATRRGSSLRTRIASRAAAVFAGEMPVEKMCSGAVNRRYSTSGPRAAM